MLITHKGNQIETAGALPALGSIAPDFMLTKTDLTDTTLADYKGKKLLLNILVSIDTGICAASARKFNEALQSLENTVVLCVSADAVFAHSRFCAAEGLTRIIPVAEMHDRTFGETYGVRIKTGLLRGLLSRAIVIIAPDGKVLYTEQVPEIAQDPDYEKALAVIKR